MCEDSKMSEDGEVEDAFEDIEDEEDRRRKRLELSERGAELVGRLQPERRSLNEMLFSQLSDAEKELFLNLAERVLEQLDEYLQHKRFAETIGTD